jgi:hypothetical protein
MNIKKIALALCLTAGAAFAQTNVLTSTTLSLAALSTDRVITVTSATGINAPAQGVIGSQLYVFAPGNPRGETMLVQSVNGTAISVARGRTGAASGWPLGATVFIGQPNWFRAYDPGGNCVTASTYIAPHVNVLTGAQFLCSPVTLTWVPSWNNPLVDAAAAPTAAVASAAGLITPSGPLFHVTGTSAITGFNIPLGFVGGSFTVIPDAIFTTTSANNIALASTAVVGKALRFTYDAVTAKFYPSY